MRKKDIRKIEENVVESTTINDIKNNRTTNKKRKIIITLFVALLLIASSGYAYNQHLVKQQEKLILATQELYESLQSQDIENYSNKELERYNTLLALREQHFAANDLNALLKVQNRLTTLNETATTRVEKEAAELQAKYDSKKDEVNIIKIVDGANEQETEIFNTRKNAVLKAIEEKVEFEKIDNSITTLKNTNTDINTRIDNDRIAHEQANLNTWTGGGSSSSGGSWSGNNSNSGNTGNSGGSWTPQPQRTCWIEIHEDYYEYELGGGTGWGIIEYPVEVCS